jgi:alkylation response protein AidB-like acyl-CoA dehydrogenase
LKKFVSQYFPSYHEHPIASPTSAISLFINILLTDHLNEVIRSADSLPADELKSRRDVSTIAAQALSRKPGEPDTRSPAAEELAVQAKIYGSETAVRVIGDPMRVVGIDSYDHDAPLGRLLQDALALPIFYDGKYRHQARSAAHDVHAARL